MKYCEKCGAQNGDEARFCNSCGTPFRVAEAKPAQAPKTMTSEEAAEIEAGVVAKAAEEAKAKEEWQTLPTGEAVKVNATSVYQEAALEPAEVVAQAREERNKKVRAAVPSISSSEQILAVLGNTFLQSVIAGAGLQRNIAVVTDRRLYYKGHTLQMKSMRETSVVEEGSVLLQDITYSGMQTKKAIWFWVVACLLALMPLFCLVSMLVAFVALANSYGFSESGYYFGRLFIYTLIFAVPLVAYLFICWKRRMDTMFTVKFAGGGIAFNVRYYGVEELENFRIVLTKAAERARG